MRRREFITLLGGAAASWPFAAVAQQPERMRRIGVLMNRPADDPDVQHLVAAFLQELQLLGWRDGNNVRIEYRFAADQGSVPRYAAELIALAPEVILAYSNPSVAALQQATRALPIVFIAVSDPVVTGFVESLVRPGGNATGFTSAEFGMSAKSLELLKETQFHPERAGHRLDRGELGSPHAAQARVLKDAHSRNAGRESRSACAMLARSNARLLHSHAGRMAA